MFLAKQSLEITSPVPCPPFRQQEAETHVSRRAHNEKAEEVGRVKTHSIQPQERERRGQKGSETQAHPRVVMVSTLGHVQAREHV